jgi:hypothetical protein
MMEASASEEVNPVTKKPHAKQIIKTPYYNSQKAAKT